MTDNEVDLKVKVTMMKSYYKEIDFANLDWSSDGTAQMPSQPLPVIDPNYVAMSFILPEIKQMHEHDYGGSLLLKTEDAKKLSIMIGDTLTLKLVKDSQK